ncbi:non-SMC mitotic condensation complex subunit 1-domain-containing protein [Phellopilus nigrolimitatus]|nr:non-SMC mitotic condensation complex subunit 1-domain-containing protein [Phellopilus nigrolimitatus]
MGDDFRLQEQCQSLQDTASYAISNEHDIRSMDSAEITALLEDAVEQVAESSDSITNTFVFDVYRSLLKYADALQGTAMNKLLDSVTSGFLVELEATMRDLDNGDPELYGTHRTPLEMYAFLLQWFVSAAEKVKSRNDDDAPAAPASRSRRGRGGKVVNARVAAKKDTQWTWFNQIPSTLALISKVLRLKTHRIWTTTPDRDAFINCLTRPAYHISESEVYMKSNDIKLGVYKVICLAVKHHGHGFGAQISIMQCLQYYEHLSEPMAEALTVLAKEFDHNQLAEEILREIAGKNFNGQDTKGPRAFSRFLVRLAELSPRLVMKQISLLLAHLDSESYPMRMALIEIIGCLIREIAMSDEEEQEAREKRLNSLFDLLTERYLDLSSYVRAKVITTLAKLCDLPVKFPKQRLTITEMTVGALEDKGSSVRRHAIALLTKLILTHPYGLMHGGLLKLEEWEERYQEICKELEAVDMKEMEKPATEKEREDGEKQSDSEDEDEDEEDEDEQFDASENDDNSEADEAITSSPMRAARKRMRPSRTSTVPLYESSEDGDAMEVEGAAPGEDMEGVEGEAGDENVEGDEGFYEEDENTTPLNSDAPTPLRTPRTPYKTPRKSMATRTPRTIPKSAFATAKKDRKKKKSKKKARKSQLDISALTDEQVALAALESSQILNLKLRKRYYAEALNFIRQIEGAMEIIGQLLGSTNKAEVLESIEFFRVAHEYQFIGAESGIKKMIHLIWSKDNSSTSEDGKELKGIRSRLLECYRNLYFDPLPDMEPKQQVNRISKNMIELTYDATLAELTSLEELMRTMMDDDQIHGDVIGKLWQVYSSDKQLPRQQRRGAIIILGMLALAKRNVVTDRVDTLLKIGLGPCGRADLLLARYTCVALQRLNGSAKKVKGSLLDKTLRLEMDNAIFRKLQDTVLFPTRSKEWFGMAEQAINTIYALGEHPDVMCNDLIKNLTRRVFSTRDKSEQAERPKSPEAMDEDPAPENADAEVISRAQSAHSSASGDRGDAFELSQLLFVVGHVAIKQIVYLELVEREWKRQKDEKEKAEKSASGNSPRHAKDGEELEQVAGNAEDEIGERIAAVRESELLYGPNSLLALFGPMIIHICGSPHKYKNKTLRTAAILAFSKLLCVSSQFCDQHHRLLFKILETSKDPNIRSNVVIALGDVAVCFSNIIDENSNELYKGLSDHNLVVKKNTLMVLTHLILNGMIKVKGQLGEMAKCLEDPERRIADLAKLFFTELSTKDNAIYNNLPDVISHLSVGEHAVDEETFQSTMKYIFSFIEKEKQAENIVEKLCYRFRLSDEPRQWRDIAFCLSLLPFKSERSVKKLIEGLPFYQDKLHEEIVFARFSEILVKARANKSANKPDSELKEFEGILEEHKRQGEEDQALEKRAEGKKAAARKRATRKTTKRKVRGKDDDSD